MTDHDPDDVDVDTFQDFDEEQQDGPELEAYAAEVIEAAQAYGIEPPP